MMDRVLGMIGMAKRAGKAVSGEFLCDKAIKERASRLIVIADDASESAKKTIIDSCSYYKVKYIIYGSMDDLGRYTGGAYRAVVSVNDGNFAKAIFDKYVVAKNSMKEGD